MLSLVDFNKVFQVDYDASHIGISAMLSQDSRGQTLGILQ